ncbi:HAMP domain-containing protein [Nocardioides guangzhouensis]|uniref:histidine kinase n=1 Tax=Nocardioides guangzhouensis TaxID=2497878 RepID=A0A4Q4ZEE4_9ACTN|nr:ATP-binding protein [Nocardioides guangzhouensis]RYP86427.1 HAMP domain-containing protein [Nocardioides guangzhouensis]
MGRTVGQRVARVVLVAAVLVLVVGGVGIAGLVATSRTSDLLLDRVEPARQANDGVLQDLTDAETGIRGWTLSGDQGALVPFLDAMESLPEHQGVLVRLSPDDAHLADLVAPQDDAVDAWIEQYANPRLDAGTGHYDPELFTTGRALFADVRAANARVDRELGRMAVDARAENRSAWTTSVALIAGAVVLGLAAVAGLGRSLVRSIQRPLAALASVLQRLAAGETGARAATEGLREIGAVGEAVNQLAVENEHGRAVETEVRETLYELDRTRSDFVSNVSHELRTPLTSIRGYLELLEGEADPAGPERRMWEAVDRNVERLSLLIEDLLMLSKVEARGTALTEIDLREVVREVVADLQPVAARRDVRVELDVPSGPLRVLADETQILRAILNVTANAVKFTRPGGWVRVRVGETGEDALVTVEDNGIGIPAGEVAGVGRRFFRGSNAVDQQVAGTGLGLRIVQTIMDRQAGSVTLESIEDEGTTVRLRMPLRGAGPPPEDPAAKPVPAVT